MAHTYSSYIAIGDSFTEGYGDDLPDGTPRGWADLVALGLALASAPATVTYANLAIRGKKLAPIVGGQLDAAISQHPALISMNGGGNDLMRPRVSIRSIADQLEQAACRAVAAGSHVLLASGANPSRNIPLGGLLQRRGDELADEVHERLPIEGATYVNNWGDAQLTELHYWSRDKLHLNALGHARVAGNVLAALQVPIPEFGAGEFVAGEFAAGEFGADEFEAGEFGAREFEAGELGALDLGAGELVGARPRTSAYWREYVLPWIGRRLTGRSSGDMRLPKIATLQPVALPPRTRPPAE